MKIMRVERLHKACLAEAVECRRDQQLCGGETRMDVEFAIAEFCVDAF